MKMENIVYNFAKISFQPRENRISTFPSTITTTTVSNNFTWSFKPSDCSTSSGGTICSTMSMSMAEKMQENTDTTTSDSDEQEEVDSQLSRGEDNDDDSDCYSKSSTLGRRGGVSRRRMPSRVSKDNFNRVCSAIMKPNKKKKRDLNTNAQTLKSIEKLYTSKRMKKFTPTNLETIFEEPSDENAADAEDDSEECAAAISSQVRVVKFGGRKLRRAISFSDGLNKNKSLVKKRRQKIKKTFGKRFALKKITMTEFHDRLNKSFDSAMVEGDELNQFPSTSKAAAAVTMDDMQLPSVAMVKTSIFD